MSRLVALIDQYRDEHGNPSDASIARGMGISPQTLSSWRNRGLKEPPAPETLRAVARFLRQDYRTVVLPAVLLDVGLLEERDGDERDDRLAAEN